MDIRGDESRGIQVYPLKSKILIGLSVLVALAVFLLVNQDYSLLSFSLILVTVGLTTTESWNRELKEDGYASLAQLYTSYLAGVFLLVAVLPALTIFLSLQLAVPVAILVVFLYGVAVKSIAYVGIEDYEVAIESYDSPAVVYLPEGPFISHIQQLAESNRTNSNETAETIEE